MIANFKFDVSRQTVGSNVLGQVTGVTMKKNATAARESVASALAFQPLSDQLATLTHGNVLVSNALNDLDWRLTHMMPLTAQLHRLKPIDIHTRLGGNRKKVWKEFINTNPNANRDQILRQLRKMKKDFGLK